MSKVYIVYNTETNKVTGPISDELKAAVFAELGIDESALVSLESDILEGRVKRLDVKGNRTHRALAEKSNDNYVVAMDGRVVLLS